MPKDNKAFIQTLDITGQWITVASTINQDQTIKKTLDRIQQSYNKMVRAIDSDGNILQLQE